MESQVQVIKKGSGISEEDYIKIIVNSVSGEESYAKRSQTIRNKMVQKFGGDWNVIVV